MSKIIIFSGLNGANRHRIYYLESRCREISLSAQDDVINGDSLSIVHWTCYV